jgi:hypothetical protein
MTFRITRLESSEGDLIKVDGWLQSDELAELERVCGEPRSGLTLDLRELRHADEASLGLLRRLTAGGARIINCSPYFSLLLGVQEDPTGHDDT